VAINTGAHENVFFPPQGIPLLTGPLQERGCFAFFSSACCCC